MGGFLNQMVIGGGQQQQAPGPQPQQAPDGNWYVQTAQGWQPVAPPNQGPPQAPQGAPAGFVMQGAPGQPTQAQQPSFAPSAPAAQNGFGQQQGGFPQQQGGFPQQQQGGFPQQQQGGFPQQQQQGGFPQQQQQGGFPQQAQNGFPQQQNGFGPPAAQNGFGGGAPVGGFVQNGAAFGGQQPHANGGFGGMMNGGGMKGPVVPFSQYMQGVEQLDSTSVNRGIWFHGNGSHLCKIDKVKGGIGESSAMPFWSVEFEIAYSTNAAQNPIGTRPAWTTNIDNAKFLDKFQKRVKAFVIAAVSSMNPNQAITEDQIGPAQIDWARGEQQPLKSTWIWVTTKEDPPKEGKDHGFTHHSFSPASPQQLQQMAQQGLIRLQ